MQVELRTPIADDDILKLAVGDTVFLSGIIVTGRDAAHKWIADNFINPSAKPSDEDKAVFQDLKSLLQGGLIYHCGPVVAGLETKQYKFVAAGPTTSIREEPYQADVMRLFNLKGVIGKGGMGQKTLEGCRNVPAVYFHAIGGAAALIAETVKEVIGVHKLEFGVPEAMWVIRVEKLPVVVTMDSHGSSLHDNIRATSKEILAGLIQ
jgi:fumarate hydratase subunit beta